MSRSKVCMVMVFVFLVGFLPVQSNSQPAKEILVTSFGGAYDDALKLGIKKFEDQYGAKVTIVPVSGAETLAKVRNREVDVIHSDPIFSLRVEAEGLVEKLDPALVPNLKNLYPVARFSDATVSTNMGAYVIAYNPKFAAKPSSWFDLENAKYKDHVALRGFRPENIELIVLFSKLAGGDEKQPDKGFAEMKKVAANAHTFVETHAQMLDLFKSGQVWIGIWSDGRIEWAKQQGVAIEGVIPKEGIFALVTTVNVIKGRPNSELAQRYVNHLLDPESGLQMARALNYFPTNRNAKLPPDVQAKMVLSGTTINQVKMADWRYLVSVYNQWSERWDKEIVR